MRGRVQHNSAAKARQRIALASDPAAVVSFSPDGKLLMACITGPERKPRAVKTWAVAE